MNFFKEQRFVYETGGKPKVEGGALDKEIKSPIDLKMEELMTKSGLVIEEAGRRSEVSKSLSDKLGEQFKNAKLTITDVSELETGLKPGLVDALEKNIGALPELKGKEEKFVDQVVGIISEKINAMLEEKYPELKGKKVEGLLDLSFTVDDSGKMEVVLKPQAELLAALEVAHKAVKDAEAVDASKKVESTKAGDKPAEGAEAAKANEGLVDAILASAVLNGTAIGTTYGNMRSTLINRVKLSEKDLLANADYMKISAANSDLRREAFVELLLAKAGAILTSTVYSEEEKYSLDVLAKVPGSFTIKISGGQLSFEMSEVFKTNYEKMRLLIESKPKADEVAAIAELKSGMSGWLLKLFGIKTDAQLVQVVRGNSPLSYFFGAVAMATGGKAFGWAKGFWEKGKASMESNPLTAKYVSVVEKAAKTFSGFSGKFKFDKLKTAVSKGVDDFIKMGTVAGKKLFKVAEGGKGMKLSGDVDLKDKTLRMIVAGKDKVEFPSSVAGIVKDGVKLTAPVKQLAAGMYELKKLPKDTFIPDGVEFKIV